MASSLEDSADAWLRDDHRIILYTFVSLALVVGGHRTWQEYHRHRENAARRARILRLVETSRRDRERERKVGLGLGLGLDAVDRDRDGVDAPPPAVAVTHDETEVLHASSSTPLSTSTSTADLKARVESANNAAKRPKDRRKRGRDVYKAVLKQERKRVSLAAAAAAAAATPESKGTQAPALSGSDADASRSRSSSRARSRSLSEYDDGNTEDTPKPRSTPAESVFQFHPTPATAAHYGDGRSDCSSLSVSDSLSSLGVATQGLSTSTSQTSDANAIYDSKHRTPTLPLTRSGPSSTASESISSSAASAGAGSPPLPLNLDVGDAEAHAAPAISQPHPSVPAVKAQPPWLGFDSSFPSRNSDNNNNDIQHPQTYPKIPSTGSAASLAVSDASASGSSGSGWENDGQVTAFYGRRASKSPPPPPRFRSLSRASASPLTNSLSLPGPGPGVGTSPSSTPPPHAQGASYRTVLEQARRREEAQRREAARFRQECDTLRLRWNEDVERGRRREAELQAQLQQMATHMQALSVTVSQMQMHPHPFLPHPHTQHGQQPLSGFHMHPTLPSLTSMPSVPGSGPYGFPPPPFASPGSYSYPLIATLPHMAPRSAPVSASGSPAREYALGAFEVPAGTFGEGAEGGEDEDEVSEELAEAILKRPGSMSVRSPSGASGSGSVTSTSPTGYGRGQGGAGGARSGSGSGSRSTSVAGRATRDGFTFASLSELGNPQPDRSAERGRERDRVVCDRHGDGLGDVEGGGGGGGGGYEGDANEAVDDSEALHTQGAEDGGRDDLSPPGSEAATGGTDNEDEVERGWCLEFEGMKGENRHERE